jgi:pimeloyl-ACP methyl ester carboxylesterase
VHQKDALDFDVASNPHNALLTQEEPNMTTRRAFVLGGALAAASAVTLPGLAYAQGSGDLQGRTQKIRTRDGAQLFVRDSGGTGRAVVMTHAWPLSADIWNFQAAALSRSGYRVITYDRRGFGRSSQPATGYDFDTFADDLAEVFEQTGIRDATLVGYSMGGGEVVRYFSRHKGRNVVKAGFVGAAAYYLLKTEDNPGGIDAAVFDGIKQGVLGDRNAYLAGLLKDVFFDAGRPATHPVTQENLDAALAMAMQASAAATASCVDAFSRTDFRAELASVKVPTLVLHGTADIPVPFAMAKAMAAGIAQSKLIEYQGASHGIVVTERDRVARDLQAFIAI